MIHRLLALVGVVLAMGVLSGVGEQWNLLPHDGAWDPTIVLGFLLLAAYLGGEVLKSIGLPGITGYILIGLLVGPSVLGLVTDQNIEQLGLIDDIAISLIALSAGGELRLSELRSRGRAMLGITAAEMTAVFVVIAGGVLVFSSYLPFTQGRELTAVLVIALMFGSIAIANSPSVAIAVINETKSAGPVSSTVLGVTVIKDVLVILFFALALSVARAALGSGGGFEGAFFLELGWEIGGSILVGAAVGWLVSLYLARLEARMVLFALAVAFLNAEIAQLLHLEVLLLSLTAGFFVENISPIRGEPFVEGIEANSLPIYALFFSLAGASIHLSELAVLWPFVFGFVIARAVAVFGGTYVGSALTNAEPAVRKYAWLGFISQAGVTLGMVIIAARAFPEWGAELRTLFVSMVAVHELIGPVLLQFGLDRAGEIGARRRKAGGTERPQDPATAVARG